MATNPSYTFGFGNHLAIAALLLASACSMGRPEPIPPTPVDPEHCGTFDGVYDYLDVEAGPARQGATLRIVARQRRGLADQSTPTDCTSDWRVSDPKLASLSEDHSTVRIAPDAPPGATVAVGYRINGKAVSASLTVVARDAFVLTGRRGQRSAEGCDGLAPIGELEFTANGGFSVTFFPIETYKDYWGSYLLHEETGALTLTVTGGNLQLPRLDLEGKVRIADDGSLVLEDMYLGQPDGRPPPSGTCRYTFG